jgi:penicillin amidase
VNSANQRTVPLGASWQGFGHSWPSPARAFRIEEVLRSKSGWDVAGFIALQNDIHSPTHLFYRDQILSTSAPKDPKAAMQWRAIQALARRWDGTADKDSAAYYFLREFRLHLIQALTSPFIASLAENVRAAATTRLRRDAVAVAMLEQKPANLLSPTFPSYDALIHQTAFETIDALSRDSKTGSFGEHTWGEFNQSHIAHPISRKLPKWVARLLDFPTIPLSGDSLVPRVIDPQPQTKAGSMRIVIDLADLSNSRFAQPGGQSAHVLSPHYRDQFATWAEGGTTPLRPGAAVVVAILQPAPIHPD